MREGFFSQSKLLQSHQSHSLDIARCGSCGLNKHCKSPKMAPYGKGGRGVLIIAEAPGCIAGDTLIDTAFRDKSIHPKGIPIKDLIGMKDFQVYSFNIEKQNFVLGTVKKVWKTGRKEVYKVTYEWEWHDKKETHFIQDSIKVTSNHPFLLKKPTYKDPYKGINEKGITYLSIEDGLKKGHSLQPFYRHIEDGYYHIGVFYKTMVKESRFLLKQKIGRNLTEKEEAHHNDRNKINDKSSNLLLETISSHAAIHMKEENVLSRPSSIKRHLEVVKSNEYRKNHSRIMKRFLNNHKVVSIEYIGVEDVYDMEVEKYNNFATQGIFIHNSEEDKRGIPLIGDSGQRLDKILKSLGIDTKRDCIKTNACICFISPKVLIYTSEGYKQLYKIKVGDLVLTHKGRFRKVLSRSQDLPIEKRRNVENLIDIKVGNNKLTVTSSHLFKTIDGWKRADKVNLNDKIQVLGEKCKICGNIYFKNPIRFDIAEDTCSQTCHNISVAKKSGKAISRSMKEQYLLGKRNGFQITKKAHEKVKELIFKGQFNSYVKTSPKNNFRGYVKAAKKRQGKNNINCHKFFIGDGEDIIANYLKQNKIEFYSQYAVEHKNFDFFLPKHNILFEVENIKKFKCLKKYIDSYYEERKKLAQKIGAKLIYIRSDNPIREIQRILKNDNHNYFFTYQSITHINNRQQKRQMYLYCLEVEEDNSYVSLGMVSHNCRPVNNETPDDEKIEACRPNVLKLIKEYQPKVIILLGLSAVKSIVGYLWDEKIDSISTWVGLQIPNQKMKALICPTYHPAYLERMKDETLNLLFKKHLQSAVIGIEQRQFVEKIDYSKDIELVYEIYKIISIIKKYLDKDCKASVDYETNTLKPETTWAKIVSCSICFNGKRTISFPWSKEIEPIMIEFFKAKNIGKIASNLKFEDRWTRKKLGISIKNWIWDTMIAAHVIDYRPKITGLKFQAFTKLGVATYNKHIEPFLKCESSKENRIHEIDKNDLLLYGGLDAKYEYMLAIEQMKILGI